MTSYQDCSQDELLGIIEKLEAENRRLRQRGKSAGDAADNDAGEMCIRDSLYAACFDANGGVFEPLFGEQDAIISDALNHASIIDGVRLCKAVRYRYANADMAELEECLKKALSLIHI